MVQEFHVVRCFTCQSFQVQQVKKVKKWSCKLCGEKQSLLKEFGRGSGADCRRHVQKLNAMRGAVMEERDRNTWSLWEQEEEQQEEKEEEKEEDEQQQKDVQVRQTQMSRWSKYLDTPEEAEPEEDVLKDRQQLHGNNRIIRKRKRSEEQADICTPDQPNTTSHPSDTTTGPSSGTTTCSSSEECLPANRWTRFLSSHCQVQEGEGPSHQAVGGANSLTCTDTITRPRPLLPVSSMFESGEDFSFGEDDFV